MYKDIHFFVFEFWTVYNTAVHDVLCMVLTFYLPSYVYIAIMYAMSIQKERE